MPNGLINPYIINSDLRPSPLLHRGRVAFGELTLNGNRAIPYTNGAPSAGRHKYVE